MEPGVPDADVARAFDRVLAAEREAAAAIEAARRESEALVEAARAERRRLLEQARQRAARVHAAAQSRLERSLARLDHGAAGPGPDLATLNEFTRRAVSRIARRLTAAEHDPH